MGVATLRARTQTRDAGMLDRPRTKQSLGEDERPTHTAGQRVNRGVSGELAEAAMEGARLRLRPILMTSFAFILGCVPLWTASGAGAVARQIMGTTVIGGMAAASGIGIFLIPAIFYLVEKLSGAAARPIVPVLPQQPLPGEGD